MGLLYRDKVAIIIMIRMGSLEIKQGLIINVIIYVYLLFFAIFQLSGFNKAVSFDR